jgi:hypothetical protein
MCKKRLLIVGDSFSSEQLSGQHGWPVLLKQDFSLTNLSSPGIGQYKILKKIESIDLDRYDAILISHTSPNRLHAPTNPLYPTGHLYHDSDIIFADAESKLNKAVLAQSMVDYFLHIFDQDYYNFIHECCCERIHSLTAHRQVVHITHFDWSGLYQFPNMINFHKFWLENRGDVAHYTDTANLTIYEDLKMELKEKLQ